jgi:tetratricopeptide (TPR) repeat protein
MGVRVSRVLVVAAMCAPWLAGCETWNKPSEWWSKPPAPGQVQTGESPPPPSTGTEAPGAEPTGSIAAGLPDPIPAAEADIRANPDSDLNLGKRYFREDNFGLAEVHFRRAVEKAPAERRVAAEAWVGLAATYDRLRRFELADRAYAQVIKIIGPTPEILNNQGYSYIMRGDYARARAKLNAAYEKDAVSNVCATVSACRPVCRPSGGTSRRGRPG